MSTHGRQPEEGDVWRTTGRLKYSMRITRATANVVWFKVIGSGVETKMPMDFLRQTFEFVEASDA